MRKIILLSVLFTARTALSAQPALDVESIQNSLIARGAHVEQLKIRMVDGITVVSGVADSPTANDEVRAAFQELGVIRVVTAIRTVPNNDQTLALLVEREVGNSRRFDNGRFSVRVTNGIVALRAVFDRETERLAAVDMIQHIPGVRGVRAEWVSRTARVSAGSTPRSGPLEIAAKRSCEENRCSQE